MAKWPRHDRIALFWQSSEGLVLLICHGGAGFVPGSTPKLDVLLRRIFIAVTDSRETSMLHVLLLMGLEGSDGQGCLPSGTSRFSYLTSSSFLACFRDIGSG